MSPDGAGSGPLRIHRAPPPTPMWDCGGRSGTGVKRCGALAHVDMVPTPRSTDPLLCMYPRWAHLAPIRRPGPPAGPALGKMQPGGAILAVPPRAGAACPCLWRLCKCNTCGPDLPRQGRQGGFKLKCSTINRIIVYLNDMLHNVKPTPNTTVIGVQTDFINSMSPSMTFILPSSQPAPSSPSTAMLPIVQVDQNSAHL